IEVSEQGPVLLFEGFVFHEVAHQIEDGTVEDFFALLDSFVSQCLGQMRFANSRRGDKQNVFSITQVITSGHLKDLFAVDGRVKLPVEVFQRLEGAKLS